jgi:uncharacterized protein YndB with AHSA1/START domain
MPYPRTILHVVDVPAPPKEVFVAISTVDGLSKWWSTKVEGDEEAGGTVRFTFVPDMFNPEMHIEALEEPNTLVWRCVDGASQWIDATIRFDLAEHDAGTRLTFQQDYGQELDDESFGIYNFNWAHYLESLRQFCETGTGKPFQPN